MNASIATAARVTFPIMTLADASLADRHGWGRARIIVVVLLIWSVLAALSVLSTVVTMPSGSTQIPWASVIAVRFADWYTCLLFVPPLLWLSRRYPVTESAWLRSITVLFVASALFVVLK